MATQGANPLPLATPNSSVPIGTVNQDIGGQLMDSTGKPVTGTLSLNVLVSVAWRYLFGTFVQRSNTISPTFTLTAGVSYSQTQMQALITQVEALSAVVGSSS
jgi:hypothetical protein